MAADLYSQTDDSTKYIWYKFQYGSRMPRYWADSVLHIPYLDTAQLLNPDGTKARAGALQMRPQDSSLYVWNGDKWNKVNPTQITDSSFVAVGDTIVIRGTGGGGGSGGTNANVGSGYRLAVVGTNNIKTIFDGYGINIDSTSNTDALTIIADSAELANYLLRRKDSTLYVTTTRLSDTAAAKVNIAGHAATSILGRSANSTGDVADIQATIAGTFAKRGTSTILFDSVDYADLKNTPDLQQPGMYFAPNEPFAAGFVVAATVIVRPTGSFSNGTPIVWGIIDDADHKNSFFDSVYGNGSNQRLVVRYPQVKNVLNVSITPDEQFAGNNVTVGPSVGTTTFEAQVSTSFPLGMRLSGNGTNTWVNNSYLDANVFFTIASYNTSTGGTGIIFNPTHARDPNRCVIQYIGNNGYSVRRLYSGLGSNNIIFVLTDAFGNPVTTSPQTTDVVILSNFGTQSRGIRMATWQTDNNEFMASLSNFWVFGLFECWMVAAPVSNTSIRVRWQTDYPSATDYKIYRSTTGIHGAFTLIHTGTEGSYTDGGLTPGTLYTYKMVAVVGGVDTDVSTFNASTNF